MTTKVQMVNDAYSQLRISGLTVNPSPSDLQLALYRMEQMMAELYEQRGLNISYNFQPTPDLNQEAGITLGFFQTISTNLAVKLCPDFGKQVPQSLKDDASASMSGAIGVSAQRNMRQQQPPLRMPSGSGNTFRWMSWNRYMSPVVNAPTGSATNYMLQGETLDFTEDFTAWLEGATIASYSILVDPLLTLDSDSDSAGIISYTITAPVQPAQTNGPYQLVLITVTDSGGRTQIRLINFSVSTPPDVPNN
jgi:hypothetical protein